ncbi:MAG TPA: hypothetical protein VLC08_06200, partial [Chitinolyticbacter sp.]|nr:hypothetical protein [Chitinolyticbacter sp.]
MQHPNPATDQVLPRGETDASAAMVCLLRIFRVAKTWGSDRKLAGTRRGSRMAGAFIAPKRSATGLLGALLNVSDSMSKLVRYIFAFFAIELTFIVVAPAVGGNIFSLTPL